MAKYLFQGSYTVEGLRALLREGGTQQCQAVAQLVTAFGGSLEHFYYAYGNDDFFIIADLPDTIATTSVSLAISATGVAQLQTVVLIAPEDMDTAAQYSVRYCPPEL